MGNIQPVKTIHHQRKKKEILGRIVPPLDRAYMYWLTRDLERINRFTPKNPQPVQPPDHYVNSCASKVAESKSGLS